MSDTTKVPVQFQPQTKDVHHGRTPAAWVGAVITFIGFAVLCVGVVLASALIVGIGLGALVLALIAVVVLRAAGLGAD
ncbi:HGxxPAAW family protein [Propionibacteriaceae bacterium Y1685]